VQQNKKDRKNALRESLEQTTLRNGLATHPQVAARGSLHKPSFLETSLVPASQMV